MIATSQLYRTLHKYAQNFQFTPVVRVFLATLNFLCAYSVQILTRALFVQLDTIQLNLLIQPACPTQLVYRTLVD